MVARNRTQHEAARKNRDYGALAPNSFRNSFRSVSGLVDDAVSIVVKHHQDDVTIIQHIAHPKIYIFAKADCVWV